MFCFASPEENGAKESEHRGGEPHPRIARPLEFKQHAENSRRLVSQGETQAGTSGAVMRSLCMERLIYRVAGRVHVEKVATDSEWLVFCLYEVDITLALNLGPLM